MYRLTDLHDTIVAQATPPGVGAIGVIRLSGPDALPMADAVFRHIKKGETLGKQAGHTAHFGHITDGERTLDEVLATVFRAPKSYTRQDTVEFSCHGSPYILQQVLQLLLRKGARLALPGEYTQRAFLNGQLDLSQAEAVADLIAADSEASHHLAMKQMRGGYSDDIRRLREQLIHFASLLELELDFAEEDVEFADRSHLKALLREILGYIDALLQSFTLGNALKSGISTVIAGRPNAGKSTLLNALLNEERAIVSDIAGTTRDTIEEVLNIRGVAFRLIDTAGIREAGDQIEAIGVQKTFEKVRQSAILMYVFDAATATAEEVKNDLQQLEHGDMRTLLIANKIDLRPDWEQHFSELPAPVLAVSAKNQLHVGSLKEQLYDLVMQGNVANSSTIVSNVRHFEALFKSSESLHDALRSLDAGITTDFIAMDIRRGIHFLGEITGDISTEDLLGNIFSKFCIGK